jgi:protein gp37
MGRWQARSRTKTWDQPKRWDRMAAASGEPWRVFCASLADVYDNEVNPEWRSDLFTLIAQTPNLTWMLLTKRIGNVPHNDLPRNVWLGITVVNQEEVDRDVPKLLRNDSAVVRWLSCEPLLGPLDLRAYLRGIDWVIVGGESGAGARPMHPEWARDIRDQCKAARTAFHFKQWGGARPKANGHLLDGAEHRAFPELLAQGLDTR